LTTKDLHHLTFVADYLRLEILALRAAHSDEF